VWIEDLADVGGRYNVLFHHLQAAALSPADSAALMASALRDLSGALPADRQACDQPFAQYLLSHS
jgi:hypothetical protein